MQKPLSDIQDCTDKLNEAHKELSSLRQRVKKLERDNKLLSITNANSEKLRELHNREKSLQYLYNDLMLKHMPDMLFIFDNNLRLVLCSQTSISFLRYASSNDVLNLPLETVFEGIIVSDWINKLHRQCLDCLNTRSLFQFSDRVNFTRDHIPAIDVQMVIAPVIEKNDILRGVVISISDITELTTTKEKAETAAKIKSNFLASMSHEIRTPMNAVKGLSELLLMTQLNEIQRDYVRKIVSSSNSLLHIINDVLDFSKIEAGKIEILTAPYNLREVINELTSVINLRSSEKELHFFVDVDPNLPARLSGDEFRVKQVLINLLSNAVKYTTTGFIRLSVQGSTLDNDSLNLRFVVSDSGMGIKEEEIPFLFDAFKRSDLHVNKTITGTGLGLTITSQLTETMHGHIRVKSDYGKGSMFTVSLPQGIVDKMPIARVTATDIKTMLVVCPHDRSENITAMLDSLGVSSLWTDSIPELPKLLDQKNPSISHCLYLESYAPDFPERVQYLLPQCAFIALKDIRQALEQSSVPTLSLFEPLLVTELADALNQDTCPLESHARPSPHEISEQLVGKKALVVDDNDINLLVAASLIESYGLDVATVESGQQALDICQNTTFDIIFMDHMMDGLDGIETTIILRNEKGPNKNTPIIALTANVLKEIQQDFYACGMNDFIAKPIDIAELYRVITSWVTPRHSPDSPCPKCKDSGNALSLKATSLSTTQQPPVTDISQNPLQGTRGAGVIRTTGPISKPSQPMGEATNASFLSFNLFTLLDDFGMYASDVLRELQGSEDEYIERLVLADKILDPLVQKLKKIEKHQEWHLFSTEITKLREVLFDIGARDCAGRAKNLALLSQGNDRSDIHLEFTSLMGNMYMLAKKLEALVPVLKGNEDNIPINDRDFLRQTLDDLHEALQAKDANMSMKTVELLVSASSNKALDSHLAIIKKLLEKEEVEKAFQQCVLAQKEIF